MYFILISLPCFIIFFYIFTKIKDNLQKDSLYFLKKMMDDDEEIICYGSFYGIVCSIACIIAIYIYVFISYLGLTSFSNIYSISLFDLIFLGIVVFVGIFLSVRIRFNEYIVLTEKAITHIYNGKSKEKILLANIKKVWFFNKTIVVFTKNNKIKFFGEFYNMDKIYCALIKLI